jgi:Fe-S-cluster containining protein
MTICPGEPVYDNVLGQIRQTENDRIKIQSHNDGTSCRYYDKVTRACAIYARRPVQCRVLECWDPVALKSIYDQDHLTRREILGGVPGLWDLVETHARRCDWRENTRLATRFRARSQGWQAAEAALLENLRYDKSLRDLVQAQGRPDPLLLPFLLGTPLLQRLRPLKLRLRRTAGRYRLTAL